jgi:hypothetical protein
VSGDTTPDSSDTPVDSAAESPPAGPDGADAALTELVAELAACIDSLGAARQRAEELQELRRQGRTWVDAVRSERPPLIVERISDALVRLNTAGSRWRREEARALHAQGMSINAIAQSFGVTRQRASVLVRE